MRSVDLIEVSFLFRKLKSDKSSHHKASHPGKEGLERHTKDISITQTLSSTTDQPIISTTQSTTTSSTSSQLSSQLSSQQSSQSTERHSADLQDSSSHHRLPSGDTGDVTPTPGEVTPPDSSRDSQTEERQGEREQQKKRKDKSAMRKSQLNAGQEDDEGKMVYCSARATALLIPPFPFDFMSPLSSPNHENHSLKIH